MARVAYISFDQVPAPKGAAVHIEAFARGLAKSFGGVDLVTVSSTGEATGPCERWCGVSHWELPALGASLIDRVLCFGAFLERWLEKHQFDIIQFRSSLEGLPILKRRRGAALVFEVNGLPSIELKYRYPGCEDDRELMRKLEAQERACVGAAARIVTPSDVTREFLVRQRGAMRSRVEVIPNGVDEELFGTTTQSPRGPVTRLLYFGTLSPWQGVDLAIRAVAQVPAISLKILGAGSRTRRDGLSRLAAKLDCADRVDFGSPVSQAALAIELEACDAVLAPLPWNDRNVVQGCCPLKVLEGMAAGRPVIASDLEVVRQLGRHEEHLLLTKPGSVDELVKAITRLRSDPGLAAELGCKARRHVREHYTWDQANEALAAVYRQIMHSRATPARPAASSVPAQN